MKEKELLTEIGRIARTSDGLTSALNGIQTLVAKECGGAMLMIRPSGGAPVTSTPAVSAFLESREFPFRGLYMAPLSPGSTTSKHPEPRTLVACIGTWGVSGDTLSRVTAHIGRQLSSLSPAQYQEAA